MSSSFVSLQRARAALFWRPFRRFAKDRRGTTAIEFGLIALPFFMLAFGIMGSGLHFFTDNALQHAVENASRKLRTGQAQKAGMTVEQFKQEICNDAGQIIECGPKLQVHVQKGSNWSDITPRSCIDGGGLASSGGNPTDNIEDSSGGAGEVVLVTACYEWELAQHLAFMGYGNMPNGSALIQAAATFRTEPYQ